MRIRQNTVVNPVAYDTYEHWNTSLVTDSYSRVGYQLPNNTSVCYDDVHSNFRSGDGDNGGPFELSSKKYIEIVPAAYDTGFVPPDLAGRTSNWGWGSWRRNGEVFPTSYWDYGGSRPEQCKEIGDYPSAAFSNIEIMVKGTTALSRAIPTNPSFGLARSIGELRKDGIPTIIGLQTLKEKAHYLRNSGNEYLNVEFGWAPMISDLLGFARTVKGTNKVISQYLHSADAKIRRRYDYPTKQTVLQRVGGACYMSADLDHELWAGAQTVTSRQETGFSGAFRYHIPLGDDFPSRMTRWESEANKLLGLRPTPKLVWDLAPWTWATDWFLNTGDVLNNISRLGADGLVMQYGYVMSGVVTTTRTEARYTYRGVPLFASTTLQEKDLRRHTATPYGFGFDMTALSPTQDAVLVALGLSHGRR